MAQVNEKPVMTESWVPKVEMAACNVRLCFSRSLAAYRFETMDRTMIESTRKHIFALRSEA